MVLFLCGFSLQGSEILRLKWQTGNGVALWLDICFASTDAIPVQQRYKWLLAGRPATGYIDPGPLVCSCMAVGENIIVNAIAKQQCHSAQAVGEACRAGTNCGSCVGQINALIEEYAS